MVDSNIREDKYEYSEENSFFVHKRFCEEFLEQTQEEFKKILPKVQGFFDTVNFSKRVEYLKEFYGDNFENFAPEDFMTATDKLHGRPYKVEYIYKALFAGIM